MKPSRWRFRLKTLVGGTLMIGLACVALQKLTTDPMICRGEPVRSSNHQWNPNTPAGEGASVAYYTCRSCKVRVPDSGGKAGFVARASHHD